MQDVTDLSFGEAYEKMHAYPSRGTRADNDGLPARPTLARYAVSEALGADPFGSAINSETSAVLAALIRLSDPSEDRSIPEIIAATDSKATLRETAEKTVLDRFPSAETCEPAFALTGSVNHSSAALAAVCAVSEEINPIEAVRSNLEGETVALGGEDA